MNAGAQGLGPFCAAFPDILVGGWVRNGISGTQTGDTGADLAHHAMHWSPEIHLKFD